MEISEAIQVIKLMHCHDCCKTFEGSECKNTECYEALDIAIDAMHNQELANEEMEWGVRDDD